jgi:hypothetical protein
VDLPDAGSAEHVALAAARELLRTRAYVDENIELQQWFEIVDGAGVLQAIIPLKAGILCDDAITAPAHAPSPLEQLAGSRG